MSKALLARRLTQTVTLLMEGSVDGEDEHGNTQHVTATLDVRGFAGEQDRSEESQGRVIGEGYALFLEATSPITGWDAVIIDGVRFEVIGHPWQVFNPRTAQVSHVRADIRRAGTDG